MNMDADQEAQIAVVEYSPPTVCVQVADQEAFAFEHLFAQPKMRDCSSTHSPNKPILLTSLDPSIQSYLRA